jgi:hypothetical protein
MFRRVPARTAELRRRLMLAESDMLLEDVEMLRLRDAREAPLRLREAIRSLQIRLGRRNPPPMPATVDAAQDLVFAVQQRLMAANPRNPRPIRHAGRPTGQPIVARVRARRTWKLLTLPAPPTNGNDAEWLELVDATVERAWDRWCYAQQHALRAAKLHVRARIAVAVARVAWENYWNLVEDAERIREMLSASRARLAGESGEARSP